MKPFAPFVAIFLAFPLSLSAAKKKGATEDWIEPMRQVHARFTGTPGTFAHFGDSITVTLAFWAGLESKPKNMTNEVEKAYHLVKHYQKPECWRGWKGPDFGNQGSMTIRWADENVDKWLARLNPEVALIMFGSNDVGQMDVEEYAAKMRSVVERCLKNGTSRLSLARCRREAGTWKSPRSSRTRSAPSLRSLTCHCPITTLRFSSAARMIGTAHWQNSKRFPETFIKCRP
jgi:hypothetical protein